MKKILFVLITVLLSVSIGSAQEKESFDQKADFKSGSVITSVNKEVIEYKFKSFEDLNEGIADIVIDFDCDSNENFKQGLDLAIEIKLEITIGITSIVLSEVIISKCSQEMGALITKRLKAIAIAAAI